MSVSTNDKTGIKNSAKNDCVTKNDISFGVKIVTYKRPNRFTQKSLRLALESVLSQTYKNWKVFLVGDHYDNEQELLQIASIIPKNKIFVTNLPTSPERSKYKGKDLFRCAAVTACNVALAIMKYEVDVCATLDDDDAWFSNHLTTLADAYSDPSVSFAFTKGYNHQLSKYLPVKDEEFQYPIPYNVLHSTTSWKTDIDLQYENPVKLEIPDIPSDAFLWTKMARWLRIHNLVSRHIPIETIKPHTPYHWNNSKIQFLMP